jgi:hypothetical protein
MTDLMHVALANSTAELHTCRMNSEVDYRLAALCQFAEELEVVVALLGRKTPKVHNLACGQILRISARLRAACALTSDLDCHLALANVLEHQAFTHEPEHRELFRWSLKAILRCAKKDVRVLEEHRKSVRLVAA